MNDIRDPRPQAWSGEDREAHYRPLSVTALLALIVGLLSGLSVVHPVFLLLSAAGVVLGWRALRQFRRVGGEMSGQWLAVAGISLSLVVGPAAATVAAYAEARGVPHGYQAVSYTALAADPADLQALPPKAFGLENKQVFIRGYMYPGKLQSGIEHFVMSRDNGSCPFCLPNPVPTDLIMVRLMGDLRIDYTNRQIGVGGRLHLEHDPAKRAANGVAYALDADCVRMW